jgi:hypothetical protein
VNNDPNTISIKTERCIDEDDYETSTCRKAQRDNFSWSYEAFLCTHSPTEKALGTQPSSSRMLADETMSESFIGGMMMIRSYEEHRQLNERSGACVVSKES